MRESLGVGGVIYKPFHHDHRHDIVSSEAVAYRTSRGM